jgi:hypothetical protein
MNQPKALSGPLLLKLVQVPLTWTVAELGSASWLVLMLGLLVLVWLVYFAIKSYHVKHDLPPPLSPIELWLKALTQYPFCFLIASVTLPVMLSHVAFA